MHTSETVFFSYDCGIGGVSPRVRPIPMDCPTAFHPWWPRDERFWDDQSVPRGFWRPPTAYS